MDEERVLNLFDFYWFDRQILTKLLYFPFPDPVPLGDVAAGGSPPISHNPSLLQRSFSHQLSSKSDSLSPTSVLEVPRLETLFSGKESGTPSSIESGFEDRRHKMTASRPRKMRESKSLSDLEFEELKGFMDLGFTFSEGDIDSKLISLLPGLQRLGKKDGQSEIADKFVQRPYLSEAWGVTREDYRPPGEHRMLPAGWEDMDMKDRLRYWAQAVASTVR